MLGGLEDGPIGQMAKIEKDCGQKSFRPCHVVSPEGAALISLAKQKGKHGSSISSGNRIWTCVGSG